MHRRWLHLVAAGRLDDNEDRVVMCQLIGIWLDLDNFGDLILFPDLRCKGFNFPLDWGMGYVKLFESPPVKWLITGGSRQNWVQMEGVK